MLLNGGNSGDTRDMMNTSSVENMCSVMPAVLLCSLLDNASRRQKLKGGCLSELDLSLLTEAMTRVQSLKHQIIHAPNEPSSPLALRHSPTDVIDVTSTAPVAASQQRHLVQLVDNSGCGSTVPAASKSAVVNPARYKTEMCRQFEENGTCRYGEKCQFAHGYSEVRRLPRHPKYKTEMCRTYHNTGFCPYGLRCHFIHNEDERLLATSTNTGPASATYTTSSSSAVHHHHSAPSSPNCDIITDLSSLVLTADGSARTDEVRCHFSPAAADSNATGVGIESRPIHGSCWRRASPDQLSPAATTTELVQRGRPILARTTPDPIPGPLPAALNPFPTTDPMDSTSQIVFKFSPSTNTHVPLSSASLVPTIN